MAISAQPRELVITIVLRDLKTPVAVRRRASNGHPLIQADLAVLRGDPIARAAAFQALLDIAEEDGFATS